MMAKTKFKQTEIGMIPEDWEVVKLRKVLAQNIKHGIYKPKEFFHQNGVRIIKMGEINNKNRIYNQEMERVLVSDEEIGRFGVHERDIIFARTSMMTGGLGNCCMIMEQKEPLIFDGNLLCAVIDKTIADSEFYLYYFKSKRGINEISKMTTGTQSRNIPGSKLMEVNVPILELSEQKKISKILSDIDYKIELNKYMNEALESLGQAIFKRWFVEFEFPNENEKPYKSSGGEMIESELGNIPEGWRIGFLDDCYSTKLIKPGIEEFDGEKIYLDTASVKNSDIIDITTKITNGNRPSRANMHPLKNSVWFAKMKNSKKNILINESYNWVLDNAILSTGFSGLETLNDHLYYIWNVINTTEFEVKKDLLCSGTTMESINNENIRRIKFVIPEKSLLDNFNKLVSSNYNKISVNKQQIATLQKTRDLLLPKLMSGKIRVSLEVKE